MPSKQWEGQEDMSVRWWLLEGRVGRGCGVAPDPAWVAADFFNITFY